MRKLRKHGRISRRNLAWAAGDMKSFARFRPRDRCNSLYAMAWLAGRRLCAQLNDRGSMVDCDQALKMEPGNYEIYTTRAWCRKELTGWTKAQGCIASGVDMRIASSRLSSASGARPESGSSHH